MGRARRADLSILACRLLEGMTDDVDHALTGAHALGRWQGLFSLHAAAFEEG